MFKRKQIYIILIIIFTLLLCVDVIVYALTASNSADFTYGASDDMSGMPQMGENMQDMSGENFDMSQIPEGEDGERPDMSDENFDMSQMPGGEDGERSDMSDQNFDMSQMQGGPGRTEETDVSDSNLLNSIVGFISNWWILIGIVCIVIDGLCIFMLIRIGKNKIISDDFTDEIKYRNALEEPNISSYEKRRRKKRRMIWAVGIIMVIILLVVGALLVIERIYNAQISAAESVTVVSAEASGTEMDTVIYGTGTLEENEVEAITIPDGVEITEYYVENGDIVKAGDVIASVDHTSVVNTIATVQEAMDILDEDIEEASDDTIESVIYAAVDGRVKVIYAEEDVDVSDTMYEYGALMLISLDGLMAVDIETEAEMAAGESVVVILADGTEEEGRVDSASNGVVTITVTDDGTTYGEEVTVLDEDGNLLGSASLYIHSELKVTGYSGTVSRIRVVENKKVYAEGRLINLTDTDYTAEYELLIQQRGEYEDIMLTLFKLYQDNNIYAEFSGTVSDINEENAMYASLPDETVIFISNIQTSLTASNMLTQSVATLEYNTVETEQSGYLTVYNEYGEQKLIKLGNNPTGIGDTTVETYSNFGASVTKVSYGVITLKGYYTTSPITDYTSPGLVTEMMINEKQISPPENTPVYMYVDGIWTQYSLNDISAGDTLIVTYSGTDIVWIVIVKKTESGGGNTGSTNKQSGGGGSSSYSSGSTVEEVEETAEDIYTISENEIASITPDEKMNVTITIDEMDILLMETGQEAIITLDAIEGETYSGILSDIDMTGTNSGGSTKYTAMVTLDKTDQMIAGMNASVSITISSTQCNVTIPVAAIIESGTDAYVYTNYNKEEEILSGLVAVSTGLSDGTNVEILSGLNDGDIVWYEYNDTVNISSSVVDSSGGGGFNIMGMLGGR